MKINNKLNMFFKGVLFYKMESATVALGPKIRKMGQ
jgi:hypothetical protein